MGDKKKSPAMNQLEEKKFANPFTSPTNYFQFLFYAIFVWPLKFIFNLRTINLSRIRMEKPILAVASHGSMWDAFLVLSAMGFRNFIRMFPWRSPITKSLYRLPWVWIFSKIIGLYKIEPKGELDESLKSTFEFIDKGFSVFFFPSGRRTRYGEVAEPKRGVGYICQKRDVNFLPVRIIYKKYNSSGFGKIRGAKIIFGDVFSSTDIRQEFKSDEYHLKIMEKIMNISEAEKLPIKNNFRTEVVSGFNEKYLESILLIDKRSFPPGWEYNDERGYFKEMLSNSENINVFLKDGESLVGYLLAKPHSAAIKELKDDDPLMKEDYDRYYIETMAILPEYRGGYGYLELTYRVIAEVKKRGTDKFSMHMRKTKGLSSSFQNLFGKDVTEIRSIEHWKWGGGEPYDYIEAAYKKPLWYLRISIWIYKLLRKFKKG
jgi:1-acyl-sn-glycerol-3-phosphate acyltransferase